MAETIAARPSSITRPWPLVTFKHHPLQWMANKSQTLAYKLIAAFIALLIIAAAYYIGLETIPAVTAWWHHLIPNPTRRHNVRDVGQGAAAKLLATALVWNVYRHRKPHPRLDRIEQALLVPNVFDTRRAGGILLALGIFWVIVYSIPGYEGGHLVGVIFAHNASHFHGIAQWVNSTMQSNLPPHGASLWQRTENVWTQGWNKKLQGYCAVSFWGKRPAGALADDWQRRFAERRILLDRPVRWFHVAPFRARYNDLRLNASSDTFKPAKRHKLLSRFLLGLGFALAVFGWVILTFIAH